MKKHFSRSSKYALGLFVFVLTLSLTLGMSYSQAIRPDRDNPNIRAAIQAQNRHTHKLKRIPGVVGTGTGIGPDGLPVIKVFTTRARIAEIPKNLDGFPVQEEVTGIIVAFDCPGGPECWWNRPVPIGVSTGHPAITAGTIGCRVKDADGNVYALSNNHVYANSNIATIGDDVIQPGTFDGGSLPDDYIGTLHDFVEIDFNGGNNTVDAAIAKSSLGDLGNATPADGYGTPSSTIVDAFPGQAVKKYGRTTGLQPGEVSAINVEVDVCYEGFIFCTKLATFVNQIIITPGAFSDPGDSGSLIVTNDAHSNPVGLLFAGSDTHTVANPIGVVLDAFADHGFVLSIDGSSSGNIPPHAEFTYTTDNLTLNFTDTSYDYDDGTVVSWDWDFGDNSTSTVQNPVHTYATAGTYAVSLTVTDDGEATDTTLQNVTVTPEGVATISYLNDPYPDISIPDCEFLSISTCIPGIITSFIYVPEPDSLAVWQIASGEDQGVEVNITHTYRGDLGIKLTSPEGTEAPLKVPDPTENGPYDEPETYKPTKFVNENSQGCWKLTVSDEMWEDFGTLNNWTLTIDGVPTAPVNQAPTVTITAPANGATFTEGDSVTFTGTADDSNDVDISAQIVWNSSIGGDFGTGASVTTTTLSDGTHIITARVEERVEDPADRTGCNSISVYLRRICNDNGTCEAGENCNNCPSDCESGEGACGNGICEPSIGEDCLSCSNDCAGKQGGKPSKRFCCGDGAGDNPVGCNDPRCTEGEFQCGDTVSYCCGDDVCEGAEDSNSCGVDCFCNNGTCDPGEKQCNETGGGYICAVDCEDPLPESDCRDGKDNDCDGLTDGADTDCPQGECLLRGEVCGGNSECCSERCHRGVCK
jgi:PKD repeat protein